MGSCDQLSFSKYRAMVGDHALYLSLALLAALAYPYYAAADTSAKADNSNGKPAVSTARMSDTKSSIMATNWTFLVLWLATRPSPFESSDGNYNLVYDLVMTNFSSSPGTLKQLEVVDADSNKVLQSWTWKSHEDLLVKKGKPGLEFAACECAPCFINLSFAMENP